MQDFVHQPYVYADMCYITCNTSSGLGLGLGFLYVGGCQNYGPFLGTKI